MVQIDGPKRNVSSFGTMGVVHSTGGQIPTYQWRNINSPDACSWNVIEESTNCQLTPRIIGCSIRDNSD
jgi:hypothetical protein